jgi:inosine-uridine nucleoside N-ribohydrolase
VLTPSETPLHDPCAILFAAEPDIAKTVPARVEVDTAPGINYGRTVVDFAGRSGKPNNCEVVIEFDVPKTHRCLVAALRTLSLRQAAGKI